MKEPGPTSIDDLLLHQRWVRALAHALVSDLDRAHDVEQETWLSALRSPPYAGGNTRAWFRAVARNAARIIHRREARRSRRETAVPAGTGPESPEAAVERVELRRRLAAAVVRLEEPARTAVVLRFFEELPPAEIATRLGVPASTVRSRIARGLARLRELLDDENEGDRRAWVVPLLGLLPGRPSPAAAAAGVLVMSAKWKALIAGLLLLVVGFAGWQLLLPLPPPSGPATRGATPVPSPEPTGDEAPPSEPETAAEDRSPEALVLENDRIEGRLVFPDGSPAGGIALLCRLEERLPVSNPYSLLSSASDGAFSIPAVRGAPYSVCIPYDSLAGVVRRVPPPQNVRGGRKDLLLEVPAVTYLPIRIRDTESGQSLPRAYARASWRESGSLRSAIGRFPPSGTLDGDGAFRLYLPVAEDLEEDVAGVELVVKVPEGYEGATFTIPRQDLRPGGLEPRTIHLRPLPDRGTTLIAEVRPATTAMPKKATASLYRGESKVWEATVEVDRGIARFERLPVGGERVEVAAGFCIGIAKNLPDREGAEIPLPVVEPSPFEVRVEPEFPSGEVGIRMRTDLELGACQAHGSTIVGFGSGRLRIEFRDPRWQYVGSEILEVEPGHRYTLRPRIRPAAPPPAAEPVPEPAPEQAWRLSSAGTGTARVAGIASIGQDPIRGAVVRLARYAVPGDDPEEANFLECETDDDGRYAFAELRGGKYLLILRTEGLPPERREIQLTDGEDLGALETRWPVGGTLVVKVLDDRGRPLTGVDVRIENPRLHWSTGKSTGEDGTAAFDRLAAGYWMIRALVGDREIRTAIRVEERGTVESVLGGVTSLEGTILGPEGEPIVGATVWIRPPTGSPDTLTGSRTSGRTNGEGHYRVTGLSAGTYMVRIQVLTGAPYSLDLGQRQVSSGEKAVFDGRIADTELSGVVRRQKTGEPVGRHEALIWVRESGAPEGDIRAQAWTLADGSWRIPGLPPGDYRLTVLPAGVPDPPRATVEVTLPPEGRRTGLVLTLPSSDD